MDASASRISIALAALAAAALLFSPILPPGGASAATADELLKRIEEKNAEIKKLEEEAAKFRDEIAAHSQRGKTLQQELNRIANLVAQLRREISLTEQQIQRTGLEIEKASLEILDKEMSMGKLRSSLGYTLQAIAEQDQESLLESLFKHLTLAAFFRRLDDAQSFQNRMLGTLENLRKLKNELAVKKAQAEEKRDELRVLNSALGDRKSIQENVQAERTALLRETRNQEARYQQMLRETEKKQEEILKEIEAIEEDLRKLVDPDSLPPARKGVLLMPVEGRLSQGYGETPFTLGAGRHFYRFHNGIDIAAPVGTPVRAADDGEVMKAGDTDRFCPRGAYGKYLVINHGNNLATMYAHMSLVRVADGQKVKRGEIIGYVGSTGLSTGPHLHFTLYDARTVELRLGPTGTCGILPFGGSLNPLLYL